MPDSHLVEGLDVEAYADLSAALAQDGADRDGILEARGLDEARWESIEERFQAALSASMEPEEGEGVPELLQRYSDAYAKAQRRLARIDVDAPMSVERLAEVTRALQRADDPSKVLEKMGVTLATFLLANQYWAVRLASDTDARERFLAALGRP